MQLLGIPPLARANTFWFFRNSFIPDLFSRALKFPSRGCFSYNDRKATVSLVNQP
jgi:hypothetical protein